MIVSSLIVVLAAAVAGHVMGYHDIVLQWASLILSWEVLGFVFVLTVIVSYKEALGGLIDRIVSGSVGGIQFEIAQGRKQVDDESETKSEDVPAPESLRQFVQENPDQLIAKYSELWSYWRHERAYNLIFGSQIRLLQHLAANGERGDAAVNVYPFYEEFLQKSGNVRILMKNWIGFLFDQHFIEQEGDETKPVLKITLIGQDFLSYIATEYKDSYMFRIW